MDCKRRRILADPKGPVRVMVGFPQQEKINSCLWAHSWRVSVCFPEKFGIHAGTPLESISTWDEGRNPAYAVLSYSFRIAVPVLVELVPTPSMYSSLA